jgi:hypothetical protein
MVGQDFLDLLAVGERREIHVAERRTHLDALDADVGECLGQLSEVALLDHRAMGICLTPDRKAERVGVELDDARGNQARRCGIGCRDPEKLPA